MQTGPQTQISTCGPMLQTMVMLPSMEMNGYMKPLVEEETKVKIYI